jgi:hypothetical protein
VKATTGEAATKARAEKPKFRDVERAIGDSGVTCKLPSHFFESPVEGTGPVQYVTHLSDAQALLVTFLSIPIKVPVANGMSATEGQITRANPGWKPKDVKSGLGRGRGAAVEKEGEIVDVEVYPVGEDHLLKLTVSGKPDARKAYAQEITKMRASLRAKSN